MHAVLLNAKWHFGNSSVLGLAAWASTVLLVCPLPHWYLRFCTGIGVSVTGSVRSILYIGLTQDEQRQDKNPIGLKLMPMTEAESDPTSCMLMTEAESNFLLPVQFRVSTSSYTYDAR
jgi:hypothetical protein